MSVITTALDCAGFGSMALAGSMALTTLASPACASPITDKYARLGGPMGMLGASQGPEFAAAGGYGRHQKFAHGSIYWSPDTGAHEVHGLILQRWLQLGGEAGYLGYPVSDELDTYDRAGRVSKFKGGELIYRPAGNIVSEVKAGDLLVDLPFPVGESWYVIQANAVSENDSHRGPYAYCYDFDWNRNQPATRGRAFTASGDGKVVWVDDNGAPGGALVNGVAQRLGPGRYASYLNILQGSYAQLHASAGPGVRPQNLPWAARPTLNDGEVVAKAGDVGATVGAYHVHYCVTTGPDRPIATPFDSVPVSFRNYSMSRNGGPWVYVASGTPRAGDVVRRELKSPLAPAAPTINDNSTPLNFGSISGTITAADGGHAAVGGKFTIAVISPWGEPITGEVVVLSATSQGPWGYKLDHVADYLGNRLVVSYDGAWTALASFASGQSLPFDLKADQTMTVNITIKAGRIPELN